MNASVGCVPAGFRGRSRPQAKQALDKARADVAAAFTRILEKRHPGIRWRSRLSNRNHGGERSSVGDPNPEAEVRVPQGVHPAEPRTTGGPMIRGYLRVSTLEHAIKGAGISAQRRAIDAWA